MVARQGTQSAPLLRRHLELGAGYPRTDAAQAVSSVDKGEGPEALTDMSVNRKQLEPSSLTSIKQSPPDAQTTTDVLESLRLFVGVLLDVAQACEIVQDHTLRTLVHCFVLAAFSQRPDVPERQWIVLDGGAGVTDRAAAILLQREDPSQLRSGAV